MRGFLLLELSGDLQGGRVGGALDGKTGDIGPELENLFGAGIVDEFPHVQGFLPDSQREIENSNLVRGAPENSGEIDEPQRGHVVHRFKEERGENECDFHFFPAHRRKL